MRCPWIPLVFLLALVPCGCSCNEEPIVDLEEPPAVYPVLVDAAPDEAYNVLFVGDGFREADLDNYYTAVEELVQGVLEQPPLCHFRDRINFYRVNVVDPHATLDTATNRVVDGIKIGVCPAWCADRTSLPPNVFTPSGSNPPAAFAGEAQPALDLEVEFCWAEEDGDPGSCELIWMEDSGLETAYALARAHEPDLTVHTLVVLANFDTTSGGGHHDSDTNGISVMVAGVDTTTLAGVQRISGTAVSLLTHELGHALGLLDEYDYGIGSEVDFVNDKNVWRPDKSPPWNALDPPEPIPWQELLVDCAPDALRECNDLDAVEAVNPDLLACLYVAESSLTGSLPAYCIDNALVWEGAFYRSNGYYAQTQESLMSDLGEEFNRWSKLLIHQQLCEYGPSPDCGTPDVALAVCP